MNTLNPWLDLGQDVERSKTEPWPDADELPWDDANPKWCAVREDVEQRAKEPRWWQGIWDDTATPYGMTEAILMKLSDQLHHDYMHGGPLKNLAVEIIHAHVDEEMTDVD